MGRKKKRFCVHGHDTEKTGRSKDGQCLVCKVEWQKSPKGKAAQKRYRNSKKGKQAQRRAWRISNEKQRINPDSAHSRNVLARHFKWWSDIEQEGRDIVTNFAVYDLRFIPDDPFVVSAGKPLELIEGLHPKIHAARMIENAILWQMDIHIPPTRK